MTRDEYVDYFINRIKTQVPLFNYQEVILREVLAREHERQISITMPKNCGRSPIQNLIDLQYKHTL